MADEPVTILAVDDLPQNLRLLDAVLSPRGYRVLTAASGEEALAMLPASGADLVLLDIVMPGIDGYETCRRIRRELGRDIVVVAVTGFGQDHDKEASARAGFDAHLTKPADPAVLTKILADCTTRRRSGRR